MSDPISSRRLDEMCEAFQIIVAAGVSDSHKRDAEILSALMELKRMRAESIPALCPEPAEWRYLFHGKGGWKHVYNREAAEALLLENQTLKPGKRHIIEALFLQSQEPTHD